MNAEIEQYLQPLPIERVTTLRSIIDLILRLYPDAEASMKYKMPTFSVGDGWVAVANQKHYISLYTCDYSHIKAFKEKHPKIKTGKGCINFKPSAELPVGDIELVIKHAIEHPKGDGL